MIIHSLRIKNVRNHREAQYELSPRATLFYGDNGVGKTSLLEAIYMVLRGSSFRGVDSEIVRSEQEWYTIAVTLDGGERALRYDARGPRVKKEFKVDGSIYQRLPKRVKYPVVLFTPYDLRLLDGSPTRRRKYLDDIIAQYNPQHTTMLRRYERAMKQRNMLLKQPYVPVDAIFPWNVILSEAGAAIIEARRQLVEQLNASINERYGDIAKQTEEITVQYSRPAVSSQQLLREYEAVLNRDQALGATTVGPHRDDMVVSVRGRMAADQVSRGENRTIILALKYIEAALLHDYLDTYPIILLDDVFGELDHTRQQHLTHTFSHNQVIITTTHSMAKKNLPKDTIATELI